MVTGNPSFSRTDEVARDVLTKILSGELKPGESVSALRLSRTYEIAAATAREVVGLLRLQRLVKIERNHAPKVITPNSGWFLVVVAELAGLSGVATELGVLKATDAQIEELAELANHASASWTDSYKEQGAAIVAVWGLFERLASVAGNSDLQRAHSEKWPAVALGFTYLRIRRNPKTLQITLKELSAAISARDRFEAVSLVHDLYDYVLRVRIDNFPLPPISAPTRLTYETDQRKPS